MNPVVFTLTRMNVNNFENSVDELQEFCTDVLPVPVQIPEYSESIEDMVRNSQSTQTTQVP